ncbi:hypothetical protein V8G54_014594 [Vigna mungo]|uniref:BAH domain-containing protein n=1 Tax=Vigna mungo TaxID=3915 RepID=A0AAQ3NGY6_VIGMU
MVNRRRLTRVATSDDEDEAPRPQPTRKRMRLLEEDNDDENEEEEKEEVPEPPQPLEDAKPIGEPVRVSGKGRGRKRHYDSFEFDGMQYTLEDPVLLVPEDKGQKPYVAIIKDITQSISGNVKVTGQWFYRPEEAEKKGGGNWQSCDTRELFYSFHRDDVPAESVMHKCVVHFVPRHKQLPKRKDHPGFIVQKVYDTVERKLWRLSDKDYEDIKQQEIDVLVQKTLERVGELLDIEPKEEPPDYVEDQIKHRRSLNRKSVSPPNASKEEEETPRSEQHPKSETPVNCVTNNASEYYGILVEFNALTGDSHRDKWLERLLQRIQYMCDCNDSKERDKGLGSGNSDEINGGSKNISSESLNDCQDKFQKNSKSFIWPDAAVSAIVSLEKASHDALSSDFMKYNQKLRQLAFNLQILPWRKGRGENLGQLVKMAKEEKRACIQLETTRIGTLVLILVLVLFGIALCESSLAKAKTKGCEGLVADKKIKEKPEETQHLQMTDGRCSKCMECKVGLREIIHAGNNERYQLECVSCGHSWYASRDEVSMPIIDSSDSKRNIGTAP